MQAEGDRNVGIHGVIRRVGFGPSGGGFDGGQENVAAAVDSGGEAVSYLSSCSVSTGSVGSFCSIVTRTRARYVDANMMAKAYLPRVDRR